MKLIRWLGKLAEQGAKKIVPTGIKLAKTETGKSLKKVVKDSAIKEATDLVSDEAITSIGAKAIKRKLSGKSSKKNKTKTCKKSKQKGSGFGSLFD